MRTNTTVLAALLVLVSFLSGCSDDDNPVTAGGKVETYLVAGLQGEEPDSATSLAIEVVSIGSAGTIVMAGHMNDFSIVLKFNKAMLRKGTHALRSEHMASYVLHSDNSTYTTAAPATGGVCFITRYSKTAVVGTFEFIARDPDSGREVHISNGRFSIDLSDD